MNSPETVHRVTTVSEAEAVAVSGGWSRTAEAAEPYRVPRPPIFGDDSHWEALESRLPDELPATRVVALPGARALHSGNWLVTADDRVVRSLSWYEHVPGRPVSSVRWANERRMRGTVLNLVTMGGANNYGHFLLDGLGRLAVADQIGITPSSVDWVVAPGFSSAGARRLMQRVGLDPARTLTVAPGQALSADLMITASLAGTTRVYRPVLPRFLRRLVHGEGPSRVIVARDSTDRRPIVNASAVYDLAERRGFTIVDPATHDLPTVFAAADIVIGAHGAGLADLAFCRPGTQVIELLPSDHMFPYYVTLAAAGDLRYAAVIGISREVRDPTTWGPSPHPVEIPLDGFDAAIAAADDGQRRRGSSVVSTAPPSAPRST